MLQIIGFYSLEGGSALYDDHGQPSNLWVTGTHIYGMVVIITNLKVMYSTNSHTIFSTLIILASIASFYVMVYIESQMPFIHHLFGLFHQAMRIPAFYFICAFFILATSFSEKLLHWTNMYMTQKKEKKQEIQEMLLQYKKAQESAMIRKGTARHMGFAFSGED